MMYEERVEASAVRQRWEYRCEQIEDEDRMEDMLNDAGENCWELVNVLQFESSISAVFKRPRDLFPSKREPQNAAANPVIQKAK